MKTVVLALLLFLAGVQLSLAGGPRVFIQVGSFAPCPPPRPVYYCPPVRPLPSVNYCGPQTSYYSWGPSVVVCGNPVTQGFTTVSPVVNATAPAIYQVPAPIMPVTVYSSVNFHRP